MFKRVSPRDLSLGVLVLVSVLLMVKSSSDALPGWLRGTRAEPWLSQFGVGNQNIHDIAGGLVVSLFIYFLVVWLPERDKRKRVRRNLQLQFDAFKKGCIREFFNAMSQSYDPALIDELKDRERFREFFNGPFSPGQIRWDAVANGLELHSVHIKSLIVEFEIFIAEVRFTLISIDVDNRQSFAFLKLLANVLYRARNCSPEYDGVKSLLGLMWSVFTGWSFIEGYPEKDPIADAIDAM